jgi:lipopolysaccharide transport system ATP-binding protein
MSDTAIQVENLSKKYKIGAAQERHDTLRDWLVSRIQRRSHNAQDDTIWALKDVSFEVKRGEVLGIIGRNGAGKSTLLKILSRITEPTEGRAVINGRVGSLLEVGTGFHQELTGRENIYLSGTILGMRKSEIDSKFDEIVDFSGVEKFIDTPIKRYSSGMMVRLGFAVAAHMNPEILIIDEVLAVGDAEFQKKCLNKMGDVSREGRTVLFVSHNIGAVNTLCSSVAYIDDGRIKSIGKTSDITRQYLSDSISIGVDSLDLLREPGYKNDVRFVEIDLVTDDGKTMIFGESLVFNLKLMSDIEVSQISLGASIFTDSGLCVGTAIALGEFSIEQNGEILLELVFESVNLAPGQYYMGFSAGHGGIESARKDIDVVIGYPSFRVTQGSTEEFPFFNWNQSWGSIVFNQTKASTLVLPHDD